MEYPKRKHPRLPGYDYGQDGVYFLTICTRNRALILSEIVGRGLVPALRMGEILELYRNQPPPLDGG